jgi:serine/threonine-protein kinase
MASGRVPFDADNFMGILTQHMYKAPVPIRALVPQPQEVPPGLEAIVLKCLSKRPEHRYQSMDELIQDLDKLKAGSVPNAVPEMMSRSGGFNVPADYFNKAKMPEPMPASPDSERRGSKWPLVAGLTGVAAAIAIVAAIFARSSQSRAAPDAATAIQPAPLKPAAAPTAEQPAAPASKQVAIAIAPPEAHVFQGEEDLGTSPVLLEVPPGKTVTLRARMDGYKDLEIKVDGSNPRESFKLERAVTRGAPTPQRPVAIKKVEPKPESKPKKPSGIGGGEIRDPWK